MEIFQRSRDFSCIESRRILVNALVRSCLERSEELTTTAVFHAEIEIVLRLERVVKGDDKRMVASSQYFLFGQRTLDLVALDHLNFAKDCAKRSR